VPIAAGISLNGISVEAARAMESGDYGLVLALHDDCLAKGFSEKEVGEAFTAEGAGLHLIPPDPEQRSHSMLQAING